MPPNERRQDGSAGQRAGGGTAGAAGSPFMVFEARRGGDEG